MRVRIPRALAGLRFDVCLAARGVRSGRRRRWICLAMPYDPRVFGYPSRTLRRRGHCHRRVAGSAAPSPSFGRSRHLALPALADLPPPSREASSSQSPLALRSELCREALRGLRSLRTLAMGPAQRRYLLPPSPRRTLAALPPQLPRPLAATPGDSGTLRRSVGLRGRGRRRLCPRRRLDGAGRCHRGRRLGRRGASRAAAATEAPRARARRHFGTLVRPTRGSLGRLALRGSPAFPIAVAVAAARLSPLMLAARGRLPSTLAADIVGPRSRVSSEVGGGGHVAPFVCPRRERFSRGASV